MRGADRRKVRIERHPRSRQTDAERKLWFAVRDPLPTLILETLLRE